jgi:succinate dehydrogenase/fumarate reductase flavoprotein subunit
VGFGASGASAAIEAAESGARVLLFEVASGHGGTSAMAGGDIYLGGGGGTSVQRANGFEDATEDFFRYMMLAGGPDADEARVRAYAEGALDHFDWLREAGVPYRETWIPGKTMMPGTGDCLILSGNEYAWPYAEQARPCPRGHLPEATGETGGFVLMDALARRAKEQGVETWLDTRAVSLIRDDEGRVHGVVVQRDGRLHYARAQGGVILCAGGFVLNREMLERHAPQVKRLADDPLSGGYDDGSGITMGVSAGGVAIHMDELFTTFTLYPPQDNVKGILVNEQGQRFINEDAYPGRVAHHCVRQVGRRIHLLLDEPLYSPPTELSRWELAAVGETWAEVEAELGFAEGALVETVARFNHHATRGEDPLFHKAADWLKPLDEPPFAAIAIPVGEAFFPYFTLGGLQVNVDGEVLDAEGRAVAGLYAAGRTACGLPRSAEDYSSGMSLGDCTFFGRRAGRHAAHRASLA